MHQQPSVVSCRWSCPTLWLPYPVWLVSERMPWTCLRDPEPGPLVDTDICRDCPRWEPRRLPAVEH
jgi:hypothetical protein